jgi:leucyl aminopeptidase (aminopeptidase T)
VSAVETYRAAERALHEVMAVAPGEQVLVVTDTMMPPAVGEALLAAAAAAGADAALALVPWRPRTALKGDQEQPSQEPPAPVAAAMERADVVFQLTQPILNGTQAESAALAAGARVLRMLLFDFYRHPTLNVVDREIEAAFIRAHAVDIPGTAQLTRDVTREVARAREVRITSPLGTDLRILQEPNLEDPPTYFTPVTWPNPIQCLDGECHEPGTWDESAGGSLGIVCDDAEGVVVVDHSTPPFGLVREPITLRVAGRRVVSIEGGADGARLERWLASYGDPNVYVCPAEWGLGMHRCCIDSGNFLEHEKAYGSIHVALGDDVRFGGGHPSPIHIDGVLFGARLEVDGRVILENGEFLL